MEKIFCLGFVMGAVGGALLVANSYKARSLVKKSQAELMQKVDEMMDEKLQSSSEKGNGKSKSDRTDKPDSAKSSSSDRSEKKTKK